MKKQEYWNCIICKKPNGFICSRKCVEEYHRTRHKEAMKYLNARKKKGDVKIEKM